MANKSLRNLLAFSVAALLCDSIVQLGFLTAATSWILNGPTKVYVGDYGSGSTSTLPKNFDLLPNWLGIAASVVAIAVCVLSIFLDNKLKHEILPVHQRRITVWGLCATASAVLSIVATGFANARYSAHSQTNPEYWLDQHTPKGGYEETEGRRMANLYYSWRSNGIALCVFGVLLVLVIFFYWAVTAEDASAEEEVPQYRAAAPPPPYTETKPEIQPRSPEAIAEAAEMDHAIKERH